MTDTIDMVYLARLKNSLFDFIFDFFPFLFTSRYGDMVDTLLEKARRGELNSES